MSGVKIIVNFPNWLKVHVQLISKHVIVQNILAQQFGVAIAVHVAVSKVLMQH